MGWTILRINNQDIESSGMTYDECFEIMKSQSAKLPLPEKVAKICFQTADGNVDALFTQKPVGMTIEGFPLKVMFCSPGGEAAQKSVKPGWKILSVNGQDLTKPPITDYSGALKVFQDAISLLPAYSETSAIVGA